MKRRPIPHTDVQVSPICLGTMTFGNPVDRDDAARIVHWALDHDVNFFDTADMYEGYDRYPGSPGGVAEEFLGVALRGRRHRAVVTTKVGNAIGGVDYRGEGLSGAHVRHQIDASLTRLQTDYVDFFEFHRPDPTTPMAESVATMAQLINTGKVRHWGVSNFLGPRIRTLVQLCDQHGWPRPVISQPPLSWLQRAEQTGSLPVCRELEIAVTPYQPLQGGLLTGKYHRGGPLEAGSRAAESKWLDEPDAALYDRLAQFEAAARTAGLTPAQYALHWVLERDGVASVVVGTKRIEQLAELVAGFEEG